ncbi:MAG: Fur family transcriptional regulator [Oscillospiraceae bacterium]
MSGAVQRNTMQKSIVLETVRSMRDHPTADMVYDRLHNNYPTISKATVYRILGQLSANGDIRKISVTSGADHYDFNISPHYHIICMECGAVADVVTDRIPQVEEPKKFITDSCGYTVCGGTVLFSGICPECRG